MDDIGRTQPRFTDASERLYNGSFRAVLEVSTDVVLKRCRVG